jgi:uncharacterized SAM-binding protein YcdF (DUF218 family)
VEIDRLAQIIWNYHHMNQPLAEAEIIFVLCSHDVRVGEYAADLFLEGYGPLLLFSGGIAHAGDLLDTGWNRPEAEVLAEAAIRRGVPEEKILLEIRARNTGENIRFAQEILEAHGLRPDSFLLVQKPYMERRAYAAFEKQWPGKRFSVTSPPISYRDYVSGPIPKEAIISIMVGDLQRIKEYPERGFQIPQEIPPPVWEAYEALVARGFDSHLMKD